MATKITDMTAAVAAALTDLLEVTQDPSGTPLTKSLSIQKVKDLFDSYFAALAHAATHTNGTDDIQDATAAQKGLATAAQITKLDGIEAGADVTDAANVNPVESDPIVGAVNGLVKANGAGAISAAVEDTDYQGVLAEGAFADGDKTKLDGIEAGAEVNNISDVNATDLTDGGETALHTHAAATPAAHAASHTDGTDDIQDATAAQKGLATTAQITKLDGIEALADVTDTANVDAAGATMNTDTTLVGNGYFLDEDNMASDDATKVPSQQSVKAYVDNSVTPPGGADTYVQFNDSGAFGGVAAFAWDGTRLYAPDLRLSSLNTGDNILTTDTDGDLQESGAKVETGPTGGSLINLIEYASTPTPIESGDLWVEAKDASTKTLNFYNGTDTFSVDLSV